MIVPKDYCACTDLNCPNHPANHDKAAVSAFRRT